MTDFMTTRITNDDELADRNTQLTRGALALAGMLTTNQTEQAVALLTAATVLIERDVGRAVAPAALMALVEPTLAGWHARRASEPVQ